MTTVEATPMTAPKSILTFFRLNAGNENTVETLRFQEDIVQKDDESDLEDDGGDSESSDDRHLYDLYLAAESQNAAVTSFFMIFKIDNSQKTTLN